MIRQAVIERYLGQSRDAYDWLKAYDGQALDAALAELDPKPCFGAITPWLHQKACFLLLAELKRFILHIGMGGGKTLLTLMLLKYRKQCGEHPKAIVFVPYLTAVDTWVEEVKKHAPDLICVPLLGSSDSNLAGLATDGDLFVICYQSAVAMVSEAVPAKNGKTKWQLSAKQVREYFSSFDMLICDEIHKCKNVSSLTYRMCRAISSQCEYVLGLTGTPFGKDLTDLWPQFYLIDFGETLGSTLGFYRAVFFKPKPNYWGGMDYKFNARLMPRLKQIIKHKSIHYSIDEFYDMPPKQYITRSLPAPPDSEAYCQASLRAIREAHKGGHYQIIESNYLKLRQLSSGFLTLKGEDNAKLQIRFEQSAKMEVLVEVVENLLSGGSCKCVVFHHFVYTNSLISERLSQLKIGHARIWGGQKDPIGQLKKFRDDPSCQVLVINVKSGSSSLNLQFANYLIFFEQPDSPIDRQQAEARVWRPGQGKRVFIYDLLVRGTVDHQLHRANEAGANLLQELLSGRVEL